MAYCQMGCRGNWKEKFGTRVDGRFFCPHCSHHYDEEELKSRVEALA